MEKQGGNKRGALVLIAADGDVILVVGQDMMKLRVHSLFLKTASKPFSAMFGSDWKEGDSMLGREGPVELPLPEDNAAALEVICNIIHHRNKEIPHTLPAHDVLEIAITADKYDCVDALKFASQTWLWPGKHKASDLMLLTAAAYLFRNALAFEELTKTMILSYNGPYISLACKEVESAMTWRVFCLLEEARSFARLKLAEILLGGVNDPTGMCVHRCGWSSKYAYAYLKVLEEKGLWPTGLFRISISEAIELADKIPDPIPEESSGHCTYEYKHCSPEYRINRSWSVENLNNSMGLCLHCVRSGSADASNCIGLHF